jgi:hypothetical protein
VSFCSKASSRGTARSTAETEAGTIRHSIGTVEQMDGNSRRREENHSIQELPMPAALCVELPSHPDSLTEVE